MNYCIKNPHLFIAAVLIMLFIAPETLQAAGMDFSDIWRYCWGDSPLNNDGSRSWLQNETSWEITNLVSQPIGRSNRNYLWIKKRLPAVVPADAYIYLHRVDQSLEVYIDKNKIYSFGEMSKKSINNFSGTPAHLIPIKKSDAGKIITVRIYSNYISIGVFGAVLLGSRYNILTGLILKNWDHLLFDSIYIFLGIVSLLLFLFHRTEKLFLCFGITALSIVFYDYSNLRLWVFFPNNPLFFTYMQCVSLYLVAMGFGAILDILFGAGYKKIIRRSWQFYLAFIIISILLSVSQILPIIYTLPIFVASVIVFLSIWIIYIIMRSIERNINAIIMAAGFILVFAFAIFYGLCELIFFKFGYNFLHIGFLLFVSCMTLVVVRHYLTLNQKLAIIKNQLDIAKDIQKSILPESAPSIDRINICVKYIPSISIGGDYYDFIQDNKNRIGVIIADVCGHGIPASIIASMIKVAFSMQKDHASSSSKVLTNMNSILGDKCGKSFITAAYIFLDLESGIVSCSRAGHCPMFIANVQGVTRIMPKGRLISSLPNFVCESISYPVAKGDRIFMYTDGFIECRNGMKEIFGYERFIRLIKENSCLKLSDLIEKIFDTVSVWKNSDGEFEDDLSLIGIEIIN
jgi:sigma-B regulation protein RsbU (phosphoserine phosphatase)